MHHLLLYVCRSGRPEETRAELPDQRCAVRLKGKRPPELLDLAAEVARRFFDQHPRNSSSASSFQHANEGYLPDRFLSRLSRPRPRSRQVAVLWRGLEESINRGSSSALSCATSALLRRCSSSD